jgi:ABC-2 type transport system ATP-binding protein
MSTVAIDCHGLSKRYGHSGPFALENLTLQIASGEVYGFLGPNGAGKSTTIRTLLNFLQPTAGGATILGKDIVRDSVEIKRHVGYLAGEIALYDHMTGSEFFDFLDALQPPRNPDYRAQLVQRFGANLDKPIATLSKGNRQKIGVIQAFMHSPEVLILDEPTSGLDPLMQEEFYKLVREHQNDGASIFLSSHNFAEVLRVCDRLGFIRDGKLVTEQSVTELSQQASHSFEFTFIGEAPLKELRALPGSTITPLNTHHVVITIEGELTPLFKTLAKYRVSHMQQQEVDLEAMFMSMYNTGDKS